MKYAFIERWRQDFEVTALCKVLEVSRSGYYVWKSRAPSKRAREDDRLKVAIRAAHRRTRETYGARRLQVELSSEGFVAGRDRIARLRRVLGIRCKQKRKFRATTNSNHRLPVAENLLNQQFEAKCPNQAWVTDITYIPTQEGWLYLAGIKDLCTCEIVGYSMGSRMTEELVNTALIRAVEAKRPASGLIYHSDRGSQYCAHGHQRRVRQYGLRASMSRRGNCYDNAPMESFWGSLKNELVHHCRYATRLEAQASIREYIEIFYNRQRLHSSLGYVSPAKFADDYDRRTVIA